MYLCSTTPVELSRRTQPDQFGPADLQNIPLPRQQHISGRPDLEGEYFCIQKLWSIVAMWSSKSLTVSICCSQRTNWAWVTVCNEMLIFAEVIGTALVPSPIFITDCKEYALFPLNPTTHARKKACREECYFILLKNPAALKRRTLACHTT